MSRVSEWLFLAALALLPCMWFPPFPWMFHVQWSDVLTALATVSWIVLRARTRTLPRPRPVHLAIAAYVGWAALSLAASSTHAHPWKALGIVELAALMILTSDFARDPSMKARIANVVTWSSLAICLLAIVGAVLFWCGIRTRLVGTYGELAPGNYPRVQSLTYQPNMLASYLLFAQTACGTSEAVPRPLRRFALALAAIAEVLTFSRGVLAFVVLCAMRYARTRRERMAALVVLALALGAIAVTSVFHVSLDVSHPFDAHLDASPSGRHETITSSWATFLAHPFLGCGADVAPGRWHGAPFDAHLTPLSIAATSGLPALCAAIVIIVLLLRARSSDRAIDAGLAALLVDASGHDVQDFRHVWVLLGLVDAARPEDSTRVEAERVPK